MFVGGTARALRRLELVLVATSPKNSAYNVRGNVVRVVVANVHAFEG